MAGRRRTPGVAMNARELLTGLLFDPQTPRASYPKNAMARLLHKPELIGICDEVRIIVGDAWRLDEIRRTSHMRSKFYTNVAILRDRDGNPKVVDMRDIEIL